MKTLSEVIAAFDPRRADENTIQDQFWSIAEVALYGGYFLVNEETRIYPVEIEFYLYVENDPKGKWQQDANMYHKGKGVPYFPKEGSLYPHRSGVDYTFENENQKYRASFLIRSYQYETGGEIIKNPTYLWEDLFGYNSIAGNGLTIRSLVMDLPSDGSMILKKLPLSRSRRNGLISMMERARPTRSPGVS